VGQATLTVVGPPDPLELRFVAGQELADALHDAPGVRRLLAEPLQRAEHHGVHGVGDGAALQ